MMTAIAKVGRRGQITIPQAVRRMLQVEEGDSVAFVYREDEVVLRPINRTLLELRGSVQVTGPQDFSGIREQVVKSRAEERARGDS